jgi:hypothetical protein
MKKNYTIVFAVITALIALCAFWGCASGGDDDDGSSSVSNTIGSAADLAKIGTPGYPLNGNYELTGDITLPAGWTPIGSGTAPFTGTFDGKGHSITITSFPSAGVDISAGFGLSNVIARGLFAYTENAAVKNLDIIVNLSSSFVINSTPIQFQLFGIVAAAAANTAFTNISISGGLDVDALSTDELTLGGIVGMLMTGSSITGCSMSGNVEISSGVGIPSGNENNIGGLVGDARGGSIIMGCSMTGEEMNVSGGNKNRIGGLAGHTKGSIINSFVSVNIDADSTASSSGDVKVGGFAGELEGDEGLAVIRESYSTGTVKGASTTGRASAGGIAGLSKENIEIKDCYASGEISVTGSGSNIAGGITGELEADSTGSITTCAVLSVSVNGGTVKRIVGWSGGGSFSLTNNIANSAMSGGSWTANADGPDGANVSVPANKSDFETTLGWDFTDVWKWKTDESRPVLKWQ